MKLKLTWQPVTPLAYATGAPERPGSLTWCYTKVSIRKLEQATYDSIAYRYICANTQTDHDSINSFRISRVTRFDCCFPGSDHSRPE